LNPALAAQYNQVPATLGGFLGVGERIDVLILREISHARKLFESLSQTNSSHNKDGETSTTLEFVVVDLLRNVTFRKTAAALDSRPTPRD
jgi:hypothetical protein